MLSFFHINAPFLLVFFDGVFFQFSRGLGLFADKILKSRTFVEVAMALNLYMKHSSTILATKTITERYRKRFEKI